MGIVQNTPGIVLKSDLQRALHIFISEIEEGRNLKPEYSAGFYFRYLIQLKKVQKRLEDLVIPDLIESDCFFIFKFYETKFVIEICSESGGTPSEIILAETPLLDVQSFSKLYGTSEGTVRQWIRRGRLPGAIKFGNEWRIPELCDVSVRKNSVRKYIWDSKLTEVPVEMDFLNEYDTIQINSTSENGKYKIYCSARFVFAHDDLELQLDAKEKEKLELWLISNPLVHAEASLIDVLIGWS